MRSGRLQAVTWSHGGQSPLQQRRLHWCRPQLLVAVQRLSHLRARHRPSHFRTPLTRRPVDGQHMFLSRQLFQWPCSCCIQGNRCIETGHLRGWEQGMRRWVCPQAQLLSTSSRQVSGQGPVWHLSWQWCLAQGRSLPQVAPHVGASWSQGRSVCSTCRVHHHGPKSPSRPSHSQQPADIGPS